MHICLNVAEIQSTIFEYCDPVENPSTLASLATTCTAFTESALNPLWRELTWLAPLIQVMPGDLWKVEIVERSKWITSPSIKVVKFTRGIEESDWPRYDYYSQKIRSLGSSKMKMRIRRSQQTYLDSSILSSLSAYRPVRRLLPNLSAFSPEFDLPMANMRTSLLFVPALLSSTVTQISIVATDPTVPPELPTLLSSIARLCPNLRFLSVHLWNAGAATPKLTAAVERLILSLHYLVSLSLARVPMSSDVIKHLGGLRTLRNCGIDKVSDMSTVRLRHLFASTRGRFQQLRQFTLEAPTFKFAADILESLQCPLTMFRVTLPDDAPSNPPLSTIANFTRSFLHHRCTPSLTSLTIGSGGRREGGEDLDLEAEKGSASNALAPLFALTALQDLDIRLPCAAKLDDNWFARAATSWPQLQSLRITSSGVPKVTLGGLIPLVANCPHLRTLCLPIAAKPFDLKTLPPGVCNTAITTLDLERSSIVAPLGVFRCLVLLFPRLEAISVGGHNSREEQKVWTRVNTLLQQSVQSQFGLGT